MSQLQTFGSRADRLPADPSNAYADNPTAARLGKRFFFDTRFSAACSAPVQRHAGSQRRAGRAPARREGGVRVLPRSGPRRRRLPLAAERHQPGRRLHGPQRALGDQRRVLAAVAVLGRARRFALEPGAGTARGRRRVRTAAACTVAHVSTTSTATTYEALFGAGSLPGSSRHGALPADGQAGRRRSFDGMSRRRPGRAINRIYATSARRSPRTSGSWSATTSTRRRSTPSWRETGRRCRRPPIRGARLFVGRAGCAECHRGPMFTRFQFHNIGAPQRGARARDRLGRFDGIAAAAWRASSTSSRPAATSATITTTAHLLALWPDDAARRRDREVQDADAAQRRKTAPYMHDGVYQTLWDVVNHYNFGGATGRYAGQRSPTVARFCSRTRAERPGRVPGALSDGPALSADAFPDFPEGLTTAPELP